MAETQAVVQQVEELPEGYRPLKEVARQRLVSYRQLLRKVKAGEVREAVRYGERYFASPSAHIPIYRMAVDRETEEDVKRDLLNKESPTKIADDYGLARNTVYRIKEKHADEFSGITQSFDEQLADFGVSGIQLRDGTYIKAVPIDEVREGLSELVKLGDEAYLDSINHMMYVSLDKLKEIVGWEDARGGPQ